VSLYFIHTKLEAIYSTFIFEMKVRLFIGIKPEEKAIQRIAEIQRVLSASEKYSNVRWIDENNIHLTLAFLGESESDKIPVLEQTVHSEIKTISPFQMKLTHVGYFPFSSSPRVVAALTPPSENLKKLHRLVHNSLDSIGIKTGNKPKFHPHLTIGRLKPRKPLQKINSIPLSISNRVESITLFQSILNPRGSIYHPLYQMFLAQK